MQKLLQAICTMCSKIKIIDRISNHYGLVKSCKSQFELEKMVDGAM